MTVGSCEFESHLLHSKKRTARFFFLCTLLRCFFFKTAEIAQLVEHNLAKVGVASSSLVFRSLVRQLFSCLFFLFYPGRSGSADIGSADISGWQVTNQE